MVITELLNEKQTICYGCYKARADFLPLCDIYQQLYRRGVIDIGERCIIQAVLDEDLTKIVLGYDNPTYEVIARALMENPPKEQGKKS